MKLGRAKTLLPLLAFLPGAIAATGNFAGISNSWDYRFAPTGSWRSLAHLDRALLRAHPGLWLRHDIPDVATQNKTLAFIAFVPRLSVYADNTLLYDYNNSAGRFTHAATIHTVALPPGAKEIEIWNPRVEFSSLGIESPYVAGADAMPGVLRRLVNDPMRRDLPNVLIGLLTIAGGIAVLALFFVRRRARNYAWIFLCVASFLYGSRLIMDSQWISFLIGYPADVWRWPIAFVTYTVGIPAILLARNALGPGWKNSLNWALAVQIAFSIFAIASDLLRHAPLSVSRLQSAWALALVVLLNLLHRPHAAVPASRELAFGFVVFTITVINANLAGLGFPAWEPGGVQLEPYGFVVLLLSFAWFVARQAFTTEEKLLAVEHELDTARRIQESILPSTIPSIPGLGIAARYIPMNAVAGDFYDFIQVDQDRIGILVADVSGHGVPAALVASMVKIAFAGQSDHAADPAAILAGMNGILHGRVQRQFVTAVYAFIDATQRSIVYASAGHPPPLLWRASTNTIEPFKKGGLVLGPFRKTLYTNKRIDFEPGDRLLLYTDGILEAANPSGDFYGDRPFPEFIRDGGKLSVARFTDDLVQDIRRWSAIQADDLTVVTVDSIR